MDKMEIGGILHRSDLGQISLTLSAKQQAAAPLLKQLSDAGISIRLIVQCKDAEGICHCKLCVAEEDLQHAVSVLKDAQSDLKIEQLDQQSGVGMLSIFGPEFQERPGLAAAMFSALAGAQIEPDAISTSIATVTCLIDAERLHEAVEVLHQNFSILGREEEEKEEEPKESAAPEE